MEAASRTLDQDKGYLTRFRGRARALWNNGKRQAAREFVTANEAKATLATGRVINVQNNARAVAIQNGNNVGRAAKDRSLKFWRKFTRSLPRLQSAAKVLIEKGKDLDNLEVSVFEELIGAVAETEAAEFGLALFAL